MSNAKTIALQAPATAKARVPVLRNFGPQPSHVPFYTRLLAYVEACAEPCTFGQLATNFAHQAGGKFPEKCLRNRLVYLVECGLLRQTGKHSACRYSRTALPMPHMVNAAKARPAELPGPGRPQALAQSGPTQPSQVVPPRQFNVFASVYVPPRGPGYRPGAGDAARMPSRGMGC